MTTKPKELGSRNENDCRCSQPAPRVAHHEFFRQNKESRRAKQQRVDPFMISQKKSRDERRLSIKDRKQRRESAR
jgi:hypothetical protein